FCLGLRAVDFTDPVRLGDDHRPGAQQPLLRPGLLCPLPQATPAPHFCPAHEPGTRRMALHIAAHAQEMIILSYREGLEAALVQMRSEEHTSELQPPCNIVYR